MCAKHRVGEGQTDGQVGLLSFWGLNAHKGNCPTAGTVGKNTEPLGSASSFAPFELLWLSFLHLENEGDRLDAF